MPLEKSPIAARTVVHKNKAFEVTLQAHLGESGLVAAKKSSKRLKTLAGILDEYVAGGSLHRLRYQGLDNDARRPAYGKQPRASFTRRDEGEPEGQGNPGNSILLPQVVADQLFGKDQEALLDQLEKDRDDVSSELDRDVGSSADLGYTQENLITATTKVGRFRTHSSASIQYVYAVVISNYHMTKDKKNSFLTGQLVVQEQDRRTGAVLDRPAIMTMKYHELVLAMKNRAFADAMFTVPEAEQTRLKEGVRFSGFRDLMEEDRLIDEAKKDCRSDEDEVDGPVAGRTRRDPRRSTAPAAAAEFYDEEDCDGGKD